MNDQTSKLDQFYTNPVIAERFVNTVDQIYRLNSFDYVIEPSMGQGFIYQYLPKDKRIGLDIQKNHPDCHEGDFLQWHPDKSGIQWDPLLCKVPKIAFIGNPPFGRNSSLAIAFFKHASKYSNVIAFIIPRSWMKYSIHRQLPKNFGLYYNALLPDNSFIYNDEPYSVPCTAQIWSTYDPKPGLDQALVEDWRNML